MSGRLGLLVLGVLPRLLTAQGVTTAAIQGIVAGEDGTPIPGATVGITNALNGRRWEVATQSTGRFLFEDVAVGGAYRIEVGAVGFAPEARVGVVLTLGQRFVADFVLRTAAIELSPVSVAATVHPVLSRERTGPSETVTAATIAALPNPGRSFLTLTTLSPQVAISPGGTFASIGGQNRLLNGFQIDGGMNNDLYTGRLPGRETLPRPISLEALQEINVLVAPFDVRHGGFSGGLANAVTKSGTNVIHGSLFGFWSDGILVGKDAAGDPAEGFTTWQYGGTIGGPIVRDRAHYFLSIDLQERFVPDPGPLITDTARGADTTLIGIRYVSAKRFQDILDTTYGLEPGTLGPSKGRVPATDVFGKVNVQLSTNSHLELSHHYASGDRWGFIERSYNQYSLSSLGQRNPSTANATRVIWTGLVGSRWSSELITSYLRLRDECRPNVPYPLIRVQADGGRLFAGTTGVCPNSTEQDAFEVTENLTAGFGAHVFTVGGRIELMSFADDQMNLRAGLWDFRSLDSLAAGLASHYERVVGGASGSGPVEFRARQIGLNLQDRWNPTPSITLTLGVRVDAPIFPDAAATNPSLQAALGVDTGRPPSGKLLWSPRLGFNYDVGGAGRRFLRGGIGLFTGRPPYAWFGSAYRDDGTHELVLICDLVKTPPFDPVQQPATCRDGTGPAPRLTIFGRDVRVPQTFKTSLGIDNRFPGGLIGTVDVLYTRVTHQLYISDANLPSPLAVAAGEGDRPLYSTSNPSSGSSTPARPVPAFNRVVRVSNSSGDHTVSLSAQLRKRFGERAEVTALYAHTRAWDRMSTTQPRAGGNLEINPLDGTLEDRALRTSYFEIPHRVQLSAAMRLPYNVQLSLLYAGESGTPFTYTIAGDANADGIGNTNLLNDIVYVPRDSLDITLVVPAHWRTLDSFIEREPCLRRQRGQILQRNSCRNPWFGALNARVTKAFPTQLGQSLELTADVYNVLNLANQHWGLSRVTTSSPSVSMLRFVGYDEGAGRGRYLVQLPGQRQVQDLASRWRLEFSVRYVF